MKPQFSLACILRSAIFLSPLASSICVADELQVSLVTSKEVEEYASGIAEKIRRTADAILCVPTDQQNFENVIRPWNQLSAQLSQEFSALNAFGDQEDTSNITASQSFNDLKAYWLEVSQNPQLQQILMNCSLNTDQQFRLDPFQRFIGARLIKMSSNAPIYLSGISEEQSSSSTDFSVLNLKSGALLAGQAAELANRILSENVDVVCIREVIADDHAYELYEILKENYAHFIYVPPTSTLDLISFHGGSGMLLASKYQMEETNFNTFQKEANDANDGFFEFIVKNQGKPLGHVYAVNLSKNAIDKAVTFKFMQVMEKIQDDVINNGESVSFVLCGDLNSLEKSQESEMIMDECIGYEENSSDRRYNRLLQSLSAISSFKTFLVKSRDSGVEVNVSVDCKWGGKGGPEFSGHIRAEAHDDNGNYVEARATQNSRGEGSTGVNGGYKPDRD